MPIEIELIEDLEKEKKLLAESWSRFDQASIPPGLKFERVLGWWRRHGKTDTRRSGFAKMPRVVLIRRDGLLAGILPLMAVQRTKKRLLRLSCLEFLTQSGTGHFLDLIHSGLNGDEVHAVFELLSGRLRFDLLQLCYLREDSVLLGAGIGTIRPHSGKVIIPLNADYDSIRKSVYSKNLRHILAKFQRRIGESGDAIRSRVLEGKQAIAGWKDEIKRVSLSKLEDEGMHSVYRDERNGDAYFASIVAAEAPFCSVFFIADRLLAYNMGYVQDGVAYAFDAAYDRKYAEAQKIGLGILAYDRLVEHFAVRCRELDMGFGLDDYKFRFSKKVVSTRMILIRGNTMKGRLLWPLVRA
jgi:CelD/BcsL family acetyltransferase involved in cellulose biosynthesis